MKKEDQELLVKHLEATALKKGDKACPSCGHTEWQAEGPYYIPQLDGAIREKMSLPSTFSLMPLAALCCGKCQYVELFAWAPIMEAAKENDES